MKILYFLEDLAQENLIKGLVERIAREREVMVEHDVRSAAGGSRAMKDFKNFVGMLKKGLRSRDVSSMFQFDVLVVAKDANCKDFNEIKKQIQKIVEGTPWEERVVYCIPNPHIERWYLEDLRALSEVAGEQLEVSAPPYKCKQDYYKSLLAHALKPLGILSGGAEIGDEIAVKLNLTHLSRIDKGFGEFLEGLRMKLR